MVCTLAGDAWGTAETADVRGGRCGRLCALWRQRCLHGRQWLLRERGCCVSTGTRIRDDRLLALQQLLLWQRRRRVARRIGGSWWQRDYGRRISCIPAGGAPNTWRLGRIGIVLLLLLLVLVLLWRRRRVCRWLLQRLRICGLVTGKFTDSRSHPAQLRARLLWEPRRGILLWLRWRGVSGSSVHDGAPMGEDSVVQAALRRLSS